MTFQLPMVHILGAAIGGGISGFFAGWLGSLLSLQQWRPWIAGIMVLAAVGLAVSGRSVTATRRQVPRSWTDVMPLRLVYFLWGTMLGSGMATFVPYSAYLVLFGGQLVAGPIVGTVSGALFGTTRECMVLIPFTRRFNPSRTMALLPLLNAQARKLNVIVMLAGSVALLLTSVQF